MTPEGRVKAKLKRLLAEHSKTPHFAYWPVPSGYGKQMVDCLFFVRNGSSTDMFAIECKREGLTKPTPRQAAIMRELRQVGVHTFIVTMRDGELEWLEQKD